MPETDATGDAEKIRFRHPAVKDGAAIWRLVIDTGVLDRNSAYAYLLLCRDFAETCVVAERGKSLLGFVAGYRPPLEREVVFVWQVGVSNKARGEGIAGAMLDHLLRAEACADVRFLETTVSPSNKASRALFQSLARRIHATLQESAGFPADLFPEENHEAEPRLRIGPFDPAQLQQARPE